MGNHLLVHADHNYQSRFSHVLYHVLHQCLVFETKRFSSENIAKLLDSIIELLDYMQHGISMVETFLTEFLDYVSDRFRAQVLALIERSSDCGTQSSWAN